MSRFDVIPASLAVKAMRDSGYRDAAHAIAELVDNSVQAGATNVDVICLDAEKRVNERVRRRLDRIAVLDDGEGMDADTLRIALQFGNGTRLDRDQQDGIGKFGMGLPNSSISQARRVDVWTWRDGKSWSCHLDVDNILDGTMKDVPEPVPAEPPSDFLALSGRPRSPSGTLVVWSKPDRVRWKTSQALLSNSSLLIGRMYRYFLNAGRVKIALKAYSIGPNGQPEENLHETVLANDPLYLMDGTSCPPLAAAEDGHAIFEEYGDPDRIEVSLPDGTKHVVAVRYSIVRSDIRKKLSDQHGNPGRSPQGRHAKKNLGVSIIRAQRELELNTQFCVGYDPTERWWGIEISFPPALDEVFGVTNNKQSATAFYPMDLDADAEAEGMTAGEYREQLLEVQDPRLTMYEVSRRIAANLSAIRKQLSRQREGTRTRQIGELDPAEVAATKATQTRKDEGRVGQSDQDEELGVDERTEEIRRHLEDQGVDAEEAREIAVAHVQNKIKYVFREAYYDGQSFFSVASRGGSIIVTINQGHQAGKYLYGLLGGEGEGDRGRSLQALKVLLCAWARMEDEAQSEVVRERLSDYRNDWGRIARDFLATAFEGDS